MFGRPGGTCMEINWIATPFRGDRFEEIWRPVAEAVLDYGAYSYAFLRSSEDPLRFMQLAAFDAREDWERYWYSEEVAEARSTATGYFQIPVVPVWYRIAGTGSLAGVDPVTG